MWKDEKEKPSRETINSTVRASRVVQRSYSVFLWSPSSGQLKALSLVSPYSFPPCPRPCSLQSRGHFILSTFFPIPGSPSDGSFWFFS